MVERVDLYLDKIGNPKEELRLGYLDLVEKHLVPGMLELLPHNAVMHKLESYLIESCWNGHLELVRFFLDKGANIHMSNDVALQSASNEGHLEVVQFLLERGANINSEGSYALQLACENGHLGNTDSGQALATQSVVRLLLDSGANIHINDDEPLQDASTNGRLEVVRLLLSRGATLNLDILRETANRGHWEVIQFLIDSEVKSPVLTDNLYAIDFMGNPILTNDPPESVITNFIENWSPSWDFPPNIIDVIHLLLDRGLDIHNQDDFILRRAAAQGYLDIVKLALSYGVNVHAKNDEALISASERGHLEVVRFLLDSGADVHADDDAAFRSAGERGHLDTIPVVRPGGIGNTDSGQAEPVESVVRLLLDWGANIHVHDNIALYWTSFRKNPELVDLLKERGLQSLTQKVLEYFRSWFK